MNIFRVSILLSVLALCLGFGNLAAQGTDPKAIPVTSPSPAPSASPDAGMAKQTEGQVDLSDVVLQLQRVNEQLAKLTGKDDLEPAGPKYPQFGGGFYFPYRNFLDIGTLNTWLSSQGNFPGLSANWLPFSNGWGGSWRLSLSENFNIGIGGWGGGVSSLGQRKATFYGALDQNADGLDDFYSYASYGISMMDFLVQVRLPISEVFTFNVGGTVGMGSESFSISQNNRDFVLATGLGGIIGDPEWSRSLLDLGLSVSLQIQPDPKADWFKLGLNTGFNYPVALSDWTASSGMHYTETAPTADYVPMNYWASFSVDFNF